MTGIQFQDINKRFGTVQALEAVNLTLPAGKIYGLLGRNGAGKTTLLRILSNRIFPDSGQVLLDGQPAQENDIAQGKLFLASEKNCYPDGMKLGEAIRQAPWFYPQFRQEQAQQLAKLFGLNPKKAVKSLSTGYGTIFRNIMALASNAPYLLLDEPVLGLDANHRELFYRQLIQHYSDTQCTILLSTHLIEEAANLVEDVIILKAGRVIRHQSREELLGQGCTVSGKAADVDRFLQQYPALGVESLGGLKTAYLERRPQQLPPELECTPLDLQKLFIQLTQSETERG